MIKLFSDIYITKGYNRSVLQDFARGEYHFIPNLLTEIIEKYDGKLEYSDVQKMLQTDDQASLYEEYYSFLYENEFIFDIDKQFIANFPPINVTYEYPYDIINISIFFSEKNIQAIKTAFENNIFFNVPNLHFFISDIISFDKIEYLINFIYSKSVKSIKIEIGKSHKEFDKFNSLIKDNPLIQIVSHDVEISVDFFETEKYKGKYPFILNHYIQYYEATTYNTYLNKRIFIDNNGDIKLTPKHNLILGNINVLKSENDLAIINKNIDYKNICSIHRGLIEVCKDCELRMMCIDDKIPIKKENYWILEEVCTYNPYISKWKTEDNYIPIEECGTYSKEAGFIPNKDKIATLNKQIWGEDE